MTVSVNKNWSHLKARAFTTGTSWVTSGQVALNLYGGTMPATANGFLPANYTSDLLVTYPTTFTMGISGNPSVHIVFGTTPTATNASATGTITWFALFHPTTSNNRCIIGVPTLTSGSGVLKLSTLDAVSGNPVTAISFDLVFTY